MKFLTTFMISLSLAFPAMASPQGSWPEDMRGYSLPRQGWIMIIPASRNEDGSVSVWNRADPWNREWTVPKATPGGTRTVAVNGDSEDMRIVSAEQIDNMSVSSLSKLASKYGADAIAVVVAGDEGDVAVAAWARGNFATWDTAIADTDQRRDAVLQTLDDIYSGTGGQQAGPATVARDREVGISIIGQRYDESVGLMEYRISADDRVLDRLAGDPAFKVTARNGDIPPSMDIVVLDGRDVSKVLREGGYPLD